MTSRSWLCLGLLFALGCAPSSSVGYEVQSQSIRLVPPAPEQPAAEVAPDVSALAEPVAEAPHRPEQRLETHAVGAAVMSAPPPPSSRRTQPRPRGLKCDFPGDRKDGVSMGIVMLRVTVDASGKPSDVKVVNDSGGFGQSARQCLLATQFLPGTDDTGAATTSSLTVTVRYQQP